MKRIIPFLLTPVLLFSLPNDYEDAMKKQDYKTAIEIAKEQVKRSKNEELSLSQKNLALALYKDQQQEEALQIFLESLKNSITKTPPVSLAEDSVFNEALSYYSEHHGLEAAKHIVKQYKKVYTENPNYHLLGFIIASAYANLGRFEEFFPIFYDSYVHYPDHFLSDKTITVLHIKLFERARTANEREVQRKLIHEYVSRAIEKNPKDTTLYKIVIGYSNEKDKSNTIQKFINKIITENIVVPRVDIIFYVQQATEHKQWNLAQNFIDKAKEWYEVSKVIASAQQYLDHQKIK